MAQMTLHGKPCGTSGDVHFPQAADLSNKIRCSYMTDRITKDHRSWNMSRIQSENTRPERHMRSLLYQAGYRFRINDSRLPGSPDIVLKKYRTVIFVHGCYWHRHENCPQTFVPNSRRKFWLDKFAQNVKRDKIKADALIAQKWRVIVVWECELKGDPLGVMKRVIRKLKSNNNVI